MDTEKRTFLRTSKVLLISKIEDDYVALKECGFENVDWWIYKDTIASRFENDIETLVSYDFFILGRGYTFSRYGILENMISYAKGKPTLLLNMEIQQGRVAGDVWYSLSGGMSLDKWNNIKITPRKIENLIDRVIEIGADCGAFEDVKRGVRTFSASDIQKFPLPSKKENLRILYLTSHITESLKEVATRLGLDVSFQNVDEFSFVKRYMLSLSDYDIVIGNGENAFQINHFGEECSEQSIETGQPLTLLANYSFNAISVDQSGVASLPEDEFREVNFSYSFGGLEVSNSKVIDSSAWCSFSKDDTSSMSRQVEIVLSLAVELYDEQRKNLGLATLEPTGLKTVADFLDEIAPLIEEKEEEERQKREVGNTISEIEYSVWEYSKKKNKKTLGTVDIAVYNSYATITVGEKCSMTIYKKSGSICVFELRTVTGNGILGNFKRFIIPDELDGFTGMMPDAKEIKLINDIRRAVDMAVCLANDESPTEQKSQRFLPIGDK